MITSPRNQQIKDALTLRRKRHRTQTGQMLIEGQRLIQDALQANTHFHTIFYTPQFAEKNAATSTLIQTVEKNAQTVLCNERVLNSLADTQTPQGIVAIVQQPILPLPQQPSLTLILDQVRDPGNVGTLLRAAEAAGVEQVFFAPLTADPFNEKVVRAAMGSHFRLPLRVCGTWDELLASINYTEHYTENQEKSSHARPSMFLADASATISYDQVEWTRNTALIVGGEATGASAIAKQFAERIAIPMRGETESLNAGIAGAVILFEAARQRRTAKSNK